VATTTRADDIASMVASRYLSCLLRHLGANVTLAGVVGDDTAGRTVKRLLEEIGIDTNLVVLDTDRCTTTKERFVGRAAGRHPHQILRVDHESTLPIGGPVEQRLLAGAFHIVGIRSPSGGCS